MIRFGVILPDYKEFKLVKQVALESEALGYDSVWITDHLFQISPPSGYRLECWALLSALASITTNIRLGTIVLCNSFRHPSVLAKMAATLDVISNGRLEFGIGAGWYESEYRGYGFPFPKPSIRIAQLEEAVQLIKEMWTKEKATFTGKFYRVEEAYNNPKPIQKPHPPIWIGGQGEKLLLKLVAKQGDGSNFWGTTPEITKRKLRVLDMYLTKIGRALSSVQRSWAGDCVISQDPEEVKSTVKKLRGDQAETFTSSNLVGTPDQVLERIQQYIDVGISYFMCAFPDYSNLESLRLFAEEVVPMLPSRR